MNTQIIAKSGYKGLIVLLILLLVSLVFDCRVLSYLCLGLLLLWGFMFRNPERTALHISPNAFLSPIDGIIKDIQTQGDTSFIKLQVDCLSVGVLRSPMEVENFSVSTRFGTPLLFAKAQKILSPKSTFKSEKFTMRIFSHFLHIPPLEISHDKLERGERMGFVKMGALRLEVKNIELKVNIGDKVLGGESVLGYLQ